jgi:hypothetical protein
MAQQNPPPFLSPDDMELFSVQVLRYLDGACSPAEIQQLKDALAGSAPCRELFVQVCRMKGNLLEVYASKRAELQHKTANVSDTLLASASAGEVAVTMGSGLAAGSNERQSPARPEHREASGDFGMDQEAPASPPPGDPGAETMIGELSGDDTIHPAPNAVEKKPGQGKEPP